MLSYVKDGDYTIKSAAVENSFIDANISALCAIEPELLAIEMLNAVQGRSRLPISVSVKSLLVNNANLHRFRDVADYWLNFRRRQDGYPCLTHLLGGKPINLRPLKSALNQRIVCRKQCLDIFSRFGVVHCDGQTDGRTELR